MRRVPLYVFGAGGHGKVVADAARAGVRYEVRGLLDDDALRGHERPLGLPVLGGRDALPGLPAGAEIALGIGDNRARSEVAMAIASYGRALATVVHPTAVVSSGVRLGEGTFVGPLAVLHTDAVAGRGCIVNTAAVVEHDCHLHDFVHVSPRAVLAGGASVGEGTQISLGALVLPGLTVGPWAILGAGAVLTRSLPGHSVAMGVPARMRAPLEEAV